MPAQVFVDHQPVTAVVSNVAPAPVYVAAPPQQVVVAQPYPQEVVVVGDPYGYHRHYHGYDRW